MWRKRNTIGAACLVLVLLLAIPGTAGAFFFFGTPFWGGGFGNLGWGGTYPYWGGFGGPNFGYGGMGPHYPSYGASPFLYNPYGYGMNSYSYSGPIALPGFAASGYSPRWRSSLYPALAASALNNNNDTLIIPASSQAADDRARLEIRVPAANAQVWLDGVRMTQTGTSRRFVTPALDPKSRYSYEVKVRWDNGSPQEETRRVSVRAGDSLMVDFTTRAN